MPARLMLLLVGSLVFSGARGDTRESGVTCEDVTMVRYYAGPAWAQFKDEVPGHRAFVRAQRLRGRLMYNGPAIDGTGGYLIWRGTDLKAVSDALDADPAVAKRTVTYSLEAWRMCGRAEG